MELLLAGGMDEYKAWLLQDSRRGVDLDRRVNNTTELIIAVEKGRADIVQLLLDRGADVNIVGGQHGTALIAAAARGYGNMVQLLLKAGADVNMVGGEYGTALIAAAARGYGNMVQLLLKAGADVNMVGGKYGTALIAAAAEEYRNINMVQLLLNVGADVNIVGGEYGTALIAAAAGWYGNIVQLLLNADADVNIVGGKHGTALIAAAAGGDTGIERVLLLLKAGADVNMVGGKHGTALIAAMNEWHTGIAQLLLKRGANVNMVVNGTTALVLATEKGHEKIVQLLLEAGADVNMVGGKHGTALIAAICTCQPPTSGNANEPVLLSILLDCNPDVSIVAGLYGTALIAAISKLQFGGQTASGWQWTFLNKLISINPVEDHINVAVGELGTALTTAISKGNVQLLRLLVGRGADVNRVSGRYGTAIGAALAADWEPEQLYGILQYLLEVGADINAINSEQVGSALGQAAYKGDTGLVSFLLERGADPFHVGSTCNPTGAYPNALDAAQSMGSKAGPDLIAMLSNVMTCRGKSSIPPRCPPFPMPHTKSGTMVLAKMDATCPNLEGTVARNHRAQAALTAHRADIPCTTLEEELLVQALVQLVIGTDTDTPEFARYGGWIRNDVRYIVSQDYDFGNAYAAARVGWRHFNRLDFLVAQHRDYWLRNAQKIDNERVNSIYQDNTGQEVIKLPYKVMPRRLWDLKSNRVVDFRMLHSELLADKCTTERQLGKEKASHLSEVPAYWAITHSWESIMDPVETPINQYQWRVPLPRGLDLERDVRQELLNYGIAYVWLDVLCLRQHTLSNRNSLDTHISEAALNETKEEEWKLDVPTIGNIYRAAQGIVRYFNGLGRPFSTEGWDNDRHWLRRAWTLQEIKTENSTINGGIPRGSTESTDTANIMNTCGMVDGKAITLRRAIRPVLKLAADVDSPSGCSIYGLIREMSQRDATQPTDKVAGLVYLLRLTQLPAYSEKISDEDAWAKCFHMLPLGRKVELLIDFPYRSEKQHWFPTWSELLSWPEIDHDSDYSPAGQMMEHIRLEKHDLVDLTESSEVANETSLFLPNIWALSSCHIINRSTQARPRDYEVRVKAKVYGFYGPYISQKPIVPASPESQLCEFTIATADLGHSNNWVVCEAVKKLKTKSKSMSVRDSGEELLEIKVLRKVGVLRTDFCGEMLAGVGASGDGSVLRRIHALFV